MEVAVESVPSNNDGEPTKCKGRRDQHHQHQQRPRPKRAEEPQHTRIWKRQRTSGGVRPAAGGAQDGEETAAPPSGGGGGGLTLLSSPPRGSDGVRVEHAAEETPLPCTGDQGGASRGPGSPEIIIIDDDDDDDEAQKDLEFQREIAALKAEIASLEALAEEHHVQSYVLRPANKQRVVQIFTITTQKPRPQQSDVNQLVS